MARYVFLLSPASTQRRRVIARWLAGCVLLSGCAGVQRQPTQPSSAVDSSLATATFDTAWKRIGDTYYDSTMRGMSWDSVRDALRPRAARSRDLKSLRTVLTDMLRPLGESHFGLIPREASEAFAASADSAARPDAAGDAGLELRLVGRGVFVWRADSGGAGWKAGVRRGWEVDAAGKTRTASVVQAAFAARDPLLQRLIPFQVPRALEHALSGSVGESVEVVFRDLRGDSRTVRLVFQRPRGLPVKFGFLPTQFAAVDEQRIVRDRDCVGVIRFTVWMTPLAADLDRAVDRARECSAIVLDLRGNPGGVVGMVMGVAGHFLTRPDSLGVLRLRGTTLRLVANPRFTDPQGQTTRPYTGRLAIIMDELSASTSEIFAGGMQATGRARIFGTRSPGLALPAVLKRLPTGDILMHVIADFALPDGTRIEGRGVIPDLDVPLQLDDMRAGRDAALTAAVNWGFARQ